MNRYLIKSDGDTIKIDADSVTWLGNELQFVENGKIIAIFVSWEYWAQCEKPKIEE